MIFKYWDELDEILRIQIIGPEDFLKDLDRSKFSRNEISIIQLTGHKGIYEHITTITHRIYALDYHSITIEFTEFDLDILIIIPLLQSAKEMANLNDEIFEALSTEFIQHCLDSNDIVKSQIYLVQIPSIVDDHTKFLNQSYTLMERSNFGNIIEFSDFRSDFTNWLNSL